MTLHRHWWGTATWWRRWCWWCLWGWRRREVYYPSDARREPVSFGGLSTVPAARLKEQMHSMAANTSTKQVRLKVTETAFVTTAAEVEKGPKVKALVVSMELVQRMVSFAESVGWKNPDRGVNLKYLPRPAVRDLVTALREAMDDEPAEPSGPAARATTRGQLRSFFALPRNRRGLLQVLDLLATGGELDVEGA